MRRFTLISSMLLMIIFSYATAWAGNIDGDLPQDRHIDRSLLPEDGTWVEQASGFSTPSRGIRYVVAVDDNVVWATGYDGANTSNYIVEFTRTTDGGATWTASDIAGYTSNWGNAMIYAVDDMHAWIPVFNTSSGGGDILATTDGGATWVDQSTAAFDGPAGFPNVIHFFDANNGFCQGDPNGGYFELYTTTDGGTNWVRVPQANIPDPVAADEYGTVGYYDAVGSTIWYTTNKGRIFKSTDMGYNWTAYDGGVGINQWKVQFKDDMYGVGLAPITGQVVATTDGGETWATVTPAGSFYTNDYCFVPGTDAAWISTGAATGLSGASYSLDDGANWTDFTSQIGLQMLAVDFVDNTVGWAGAFNTDASTGGMWKFTGEVEPPGADWVEVTLPGATGDVWGIDWVDENVVWVSCDNSDVYLSTDGGDTWTSAGNVGQEGGYSIAALDASTALVSTGPNSGDGAIYKTTDAGSTWSQVYTTSGAWFNVIDNLSSTEIWAQSDPIGGNFHIVKSTDAGDTWTLVANPPAQPSGNVFGANGSFYSIGNTLWFGTGGSGNDPMANRVYKTTGGPDGTWTYGETSQIYVGTIAFSKPSGNGVSGFWQQTDLVNVTSDGGATWTEVSASGLGTVNGLDYVHYSDYVWAATSNGVFVSDDNGQTWTQQNDQAAMNVMRFYQNADVGLAGGVGGVLYKSQLDPVPVQTGLAGDYYIPQGGNPQGFASLADAFNAINTDGVSGVVTLYIDDDLTETSNILLDYAEFDMNNRVVIKPAPGKTPNITITDFSTDNEGITIDGADWLTIDGSNATDQASRDLTITIDDNTAARWGFEIYYDSDNLTFKNFNLVYTNIMPGVSTAGFSVDGSADFGAADDLWIENVKIGDETNVFETGVGLWGSSADSPVSATLMHNEIYAGRRAITTWYIHNCLFDGNEIRVSNPAADKSFYSGIYLTGIPAEDTCIIRNNKITEIASNHSTGSFVGGVVVYGNVGDIQIYNNFIAPNFVEYGASTTTNVYGIVFGSAGWTGTCDIVNNTIVINDTEGESPSSTGNHACVGWELDATGASNIWNNILINHQDAANAFCIHWPNTAPLVSDYNDLYVSGTNSFVGLFGASSYATLGDWQTGTSLDANSSSVEAYFVSNTDLHLVAPSLGDGNLSALSLPWITTDIDGEPRNASTPYMGADENVNIPVPVELTSFTATVSHGVVELKWTTATEMNNLGFEIQRSLDNENFVAVGFVDGAGTTTETRSYSFNDTELSEGTMYYRLKQIDLDGNFAFSDVVEVENLIPEKFALSQNYPNPFNPITKINFSLPVSSKVTLKVYDILGKEVATLIDGVKEAGRYDVEFGGNNFSTGTYIYVMTAEGNDGNRFVETKKMILLK